MPTKKNNLNDMLNKTKQYVRDHFSSRLMSDTKWRKLFTALNKAKNEANIDITHVTIKFVDSTHTHIIQLPHINSLYPPRPFIDTAEFGIIELCAIEWLEIPAIAISQDIKAVRALITKLGKYPVEDLNSGL